MKSVIVAVGSAVPGEPIPNDRLAGFPAARIPLIEAKTGIRSRHHAAADQSTSDLAIEAARRCLARAGADPLGIDAVILATSTPDRLIPASATLVQHALGAARAYAFDLNSVCSGAVFGLNVADALVKSGTCRRVLLVCADVYSKFLDPADFSTYPYFGDAASAILLEAAAGDDPRGVAGVYLRSDGSGSDLIQIPAGGSRLPAAKLERARDASFQMNGRAVYDFAVDKGPEAVRRVCEMCGIGAGEIDFLVPHQANRFICEEIARRCGIASDRLVMNMMTRGNTASASVFLALDDAGLVPAAERRTVCLLAFGGGLSYGAAIVRI